VFLSGEEEEEEEEDLGNKKVVSLLGIERLN
jgi:hypothetical protein